MVLINATKYQIEAISALSSVRSLYSNKTFEFLTNDTRGITGQTRATTDAGLTARNNGLPLSGRGVTVAVLDTGIDSTHPDFASGAQIVGNVRTLDFQGSAPGFVYPAVAGGLLNSDLAMGHGTFVAGVIAGSGGASGGYYGGLAPGARVLGVSAGDASLFYVLSGIDFLSQRRAERPRGQLQLRHQRSFRCARSGQHRDQDNARLRHFGGVLGRQSGRSTQLA
jgi:serine protease AprX